MNRRIFGIENEYGVICLDNGRLVLTLDDVARRIMEQARGPMGSSFRFNGARFYLDVGAHPEYATPECDSIPLLIAQEKAGERLLEANVLAAQKKLRAEGAAGIIYAFKNNTDWAGNSYGCHENYLVDRSLSYPELTAALVPFLAARPLLVGAGKVHRRGNRAWYTLSQRANYIEEGVSAASTRHRGLISSRDEPHADRELWRRLHVVGADANMSETTILLKVGSLDLVLRALENGGSPPDLTLENAGRAVRIIDRDVTGRSPVPTSGGEATALEILEEYYQLVMGQVRDGRIPVGPTEQRVLELWRRTLDAVRDGNTEPIERDIDWVIKRRILEGYARKTGLPADSPRLAQIDLGYHDVLRSRGLYYRALERGMVSRVVGDLQVFEAKVRPPERTRAWLRGDFLHTAVDTGTAVAVDWATFRLSTTSDAEGRSVKCEDPFAFQHAGVAELTAAMRSRATARPAAALG